MRSHAPDGRGATGTKNVTQLRQGAVTLAHQARRYATRKTGEPAFTNLAHKFLHIAKLFEYVVDVTHLNPAAGGDTLLAAGVEDSRVFTLFRGHRVDDCLDPLDP